MLYPLSYGGMVVGVGGASRAADGPEVSYSTVRGWCQSLHGTTSPIHISRRRRQLLYLLSARAGCSCDLSPMVGLDEHFELRQPFLTLDAAGSIK